MAERRRDALVMVALAVLANGASLGLARFGYSLVLPAMQVGLGASYTAMGAIATANFVGHMLAAPLAGVLAVRWGTRTVLATALAVVGLATLGTALASSVAGAALWQGLAGLGTGASVVGAYAMALRWLPPERRGLAAGLVAGGSGWGMIAAGLMVPAALAGAVDSWRAGWVMLGAPALVLALATAMLGRERWPTTTSTLPAGAPDTPRSPIALARSVALWWLCGLYALWGFAYIVFVTFFGAAATASGLPAERVGQVWTLLGAFAGISGLVWGWASDRLGRMPALALVFVCQGVASAALQRATTMEWFIAAAVLFGIGGWGAVAIISAAGPEVAGAPLAPAALGLLTLAFGMGQACGPLIAGLLNDATGNLAASLLLAAAVLFAAAGLALGGRYVRRLDVS